MASTHPREASEEGSPADLGFEASRTGGETLSRGALLWPPELTAPSGHPLLSPDTPRKTWHFLECRLKDPDPSHSSFWKHEIALRVCSASIRRPRALAEQTMHHSWAPGHRDGDISAEAGPPLPEPSSLLAGDIVSHPSHVLLSPPCSISDVRGHGVRSAPRTTPAQVMRQLLSPSFTQLGLTLISPEGQVTDPQRCGANTGQRMVVSCCKCPGSERHAMREKESSRASFDLATLAASHVSSTGRLAACCHTDSSVRSWS